MSSSSIKKMMISNIGPFGEEPISIEISDIVCLVGVNNCGKSTVLDCYELAIKGGALLPAKVHFDSKTDPFVELWVEIPAGTPNVGEKWIKTDYPEYAGTGIVRCRWTWSLNDLKCNRLTFDKETGEFSEEEKAGGLDSVFTSRLPKPIRINALDQPEKESLLKLILEPITRDLQLIELDKETELGKAIGSVKSAISKELVRYEDTIKAIQKDVEGQFGNVFDSSKITIKIDPTGDLINIEDCLKKSTELLVGDLDKLLPMKTQGTGAQRTLFWSLLKVRSALQSRLEGQKHVDRIKKENEKELQKVESKIADLKAKAKLTAKQQEDLTAASARAEELKTALQTSPEVFARGHILMIDEPEIALHPSAVRAAKDQLYRLAEEEGWQVMMTTHHPAFIDPTKDHTTIVRVEKATGQSHTYRSDAEKFNEDEKNELSALLRFDLAFGEIFFAKEVYVVEGDTEYALFQELVNFSSAERPAKKGRVIVRAGGKGTIPLVLRILRQFKIPHFLLHDVDSPKTKDGKKKNSAYSINETILAEVKATQALKIPITHRVSVPNFERAHGVSATGRGKPLDAVKLLKDDADFKTKIGTLLNEVSGGSPNQAPGENYEALLKSWIAENKIDDPQFNFE